MKLTEAKLKQMITDIMTESKDRDEHVNAAFDAIEFYEEGFDGEDPTRNSRQALSGLTNLISKGIVACIKQGPSHASAQMELINKAKELGIFDEVADGVIDLSKEDASPEIRLKEAIKDKRFQDLGIPTPDDELRAKLGDEMFDKIQAADPEQGEIFKQSFDPNYPRSIKQESLDDILIPAGFKLYKWNYKLPVLHKRYNARQWSKKDSVNYDSLEFHTEYNIFSGLLRYTVRMTGKIKRARQNITIARGKIEMPKYFELSLETEEKLRDADALVLSREKDAIEKALEQYK